MRAYLLLALAAVGTVTGCVARQTAARPHQVDQAWGGAPPPYRDTFDWQKKGPLELLEHLKTVRGYSVDRVHLGWLRATDIPALVALLDSEEPCGSVDMVISSYYEAGLSTVGTEAAFLIEGFRRGRYPPSLNSTRADLNKDELRAWWQQFSQSQGRT